MHLQWKQIILENAELLSTILKYWKVYRKQISNHQQYGVQ